MQDHNSGRPKNNYPTFANQAGIGSGMGYATPIEQPMLQPQSSPDETYPAIEPGSSPEDTRDIALNESPWNFSQTGGTPQSPYDIVVQRNVPLPQGGYGTSIRQRYR